MESISIFVHLVGIHGMSPSPTRPQRSTFMNSTLSLQKERKKKTTSLAERES